MTSRERVRTLLDGKLPDRPPLYDVNCNSAIIEHFGGTVLEPATAERTVITIWFHPFYSDLQEPTQSLIHHVMHKQHASWPADALAKIVAVTPDYRGTADPMKPERTADQRLQ